MLVKRPFRTIRIGLLLNVVGVAVALSYMSTLHYLAYKVLMWTIFALYLGFIWILAFAKGRWAFQEYKRWISFFAFAVVSFFAVLFWKVALAVAVILVLICVPFILFGERYQRNAIRHFRENPPDHGGSAPALVPAGPRPPRRTGAAAKEWPRD